MHYPLQGKSKDGTLVTFKLKDGPLLINEKELVLTAIPNSPILYYNTIVRGCDVPNVFEGDLFRDSSKDLWFASYSRGMILRNVEDTSIFKYLTGDEERIKGLMGVHMNAVLSQKVLKYKYEEHKFVLSDIFGIQKDTEKILINTDGGYIVNPKEIQQYAGYKNSEGKNMYFQEGHIFMRKGRIIEVNNGVEVNITERS